jgi:hypothetical protein
MGASYRFSDWFVHPSRGTGFQDENSFAPEGKGFYNGLGGKYMIGIIGSGNVGANMAFFIAEKGVDNVLLFDIQDGLAAGKSLDMMEAAPIRGYTTTISSAGSLEQILECELMFITAGSVRKPCSR